MTHSVSSPHSIVFSRVISIACFILIFLVLFVPTTTFTGSLFPVDVWYKYILIAAIILAVLSQRIFRRETWKELSDKKWLIWSSVFIFWVGLLWLVQPEGMSDNSDVKFWLIAVGFIIFLWIASPDSWKWIPGCFVLMGLINSASAFALWVGRHFNPIYFTSVSSNPAVGGSGEGWWYLIGGGIHPVAGLRGGVAINGMADILFWPFMILLGFSVLKQRRGLAILGILIITLGIFVTYSRSTAVVMAIGIFAFFLVRRWKGVKISWRRAIIVIVVISLISILLIFLLPSTFVGTVFSRFAMWQKTFEFFGDFPRTLWSGGGYPRIGQYPFEVWDTHNMYIFLAIQYGIPGLLFFLWIFKQIFREGRNLFSRASQMRVEPHAAAALCALICFLIRGLAESQINELDLRVAFVFFLAYAMETFRKGISDAKPYPEATAT